MNRHTIKSHEQLKQLTELLKWANASDADETTPKRDARHADSRFTYGKIADAIFDILAIELTPEIARGVMRENDPNYGGNESWYEDLMIAVDWYCSGSAEWERQL